MMDFHGPIYDGGVEERRADPRWWPLVWGAPRARARGSGFSMAVSRALGVWSYYNIRVAPEVSMFCLGIMIVRTAEMWFHGDERRSDFRVGASLRLWARRSVFCREPAWLTDLQVLLGCWWRWDGSVLYPCTISNNYVLALAIELIGSVWYDWF